MPKQKMRGLIHTSRIDIFKNIAVDDVTNIINEDILKRISNESYNEFISFCNKIMDEKELIKSISCSVIGDELKFDIDYI